jgi:molecular chaperone DnaK
LDRGIAVAEGAAIYASMIQVRSSLETFSFNADTKERLLHFNLRDVLSKSWGLAVEDQKYECVINHVVLEKNSSLPCRSSLRLELTETESVNFRLKILRGNAIDPGACDHHCDVLVKSGPLGFTKGKKIDLVFSCAKEDDVSILVFDAVSGNKLESLKEFPNTFLASGKDIQRCADSIRNGFHVE